MFFQYPLRFKLFFLLLFLLFFPQGLLTQSNQIIAIGQSPVSCYASSKGASTYYIFSFSISTAINSNAFLSIVFPVEFPSGLLASSSSAPECGYMNPSYMALNCTIQNGLNVMINMGTLQPGIYQMVIGQILNPTFYESSSTFKVYTYQTQGLIDSNENLGKMAFSNPPSKNSNF
jgi:hypothetical protein